MSKIEVNKIGPQCGTTLTVGCGAGQTVVADAATVTLGRCGGTVALASGATQTGFGRTGTVDWQTGSIKTATFTAANGEGYFCNTTSGSFEVDLPAGSAGAIVSIQDYNNTFDSNALTVDPNGTEKINGGQAGGSIELATEGQGVTFVYIDATVGWRSVQDNQFTQAGVVPAYIAATGGTVTTVDTNFKVHTFTGPGTFAISAGSGALSKLDYMVIAGGASGARGSSHGGGGGAGGYRESHASSVSGPYTASPLATSTSLGPFSGPISIPITVGAGGATQPSGTGNNGSNSVFSTITSTGGGGGGAYPNGAGNPGGSGGGGTSCTGAAGAGNTPPVSPPQGQNGGVSTCGGQMAAGGGAGAVGGNAPGPAVGGAGVTTSINGTPTTRAGGGGGGSNGSSPASAGGAGGGGAGSNSPSPGTAGTANTGGGGGGDGLSSTGGAGGSGIVIIRYRFQA